MKIFVTGTTGFIGSVLAEKLLNKNHEIYAYCRNVTDRKLTLPKEINIVLGDISDGHFLKKVLKQINPDIVVHLAAQSSVAFSHEHVQENIETNLLGTINLQKACEPLSNLEKFIFAGTSEEYGNQDLRMPIKEDFPLKPNQPYAIAKVAANHYLQYCKEAQGFPAIVLRPFNTYGRTKNFTFVTEKIIYNMLTQDKVYFGSPDPIRDLSFVDDHVNGYLKTVETPFEKLENLEAINICTGVGTTIGNLAEKIKNITNFEGEIIWNVKNRPTEIDCLIGDNTLAKTFLNWKPQYTLEEGLKIAIKNIMKIVNGENK